MECEIGAGVSRPSSKTAGGQQALMNLPAQMVLPESVRSGDGYPFDWGMDVPAWGVRLCFTCFSNR